MRTDELANRVMTYLDFYSQQLVEVTRNTGDSYTYKPFKYYFVEIIDESCTTKLTDVSKGTKI